MAEGLFWLLAGLVVYAYAGYPTLIWVLARLRPRPVQKADITPDVTVIIAAYNEERAIAEKLDNTLALDYPRERLEVLVGSDASADGTEAIVAGYADRGVRLVRVEGRQGKTVVQNTCARAARGEVLVFTDATTVLEHGSVRNLVRNFADPRVGCVGARLVYTNERRSQVGAGGVSYWGYETLLKRGESRVGSLIGVSGCFYAVRKAVYTDIPGHLIGDFVIALDTVHKGYRTVYEPDAVCYETTLSQPRDEMTMRIRVAVRSYTALHAKRELLNPFRHGLFAVQLLSHKVLRYSVGPILVLLLLVNAALLNIPFYRLTFALQVGFYALAYLGHARSRGGRKRGLLSIPYYFVLANTSAIAALFRFLSGRRITVWEPKR